MEIKTVMAKRAVLLSSARAAGRVADVYVDTLCKKVLFLALDEGMLAPLESVLRFSDAVVFNDDLSFLYPADVDPTEMTSVLKKEIYTQSGSLLGTVDDLGFNKSGNVTRIYFGGRYILPSQIAAIGDVILLKGEKRAGKGVRLPRPKRDYPVKILDGARGQVLYSSEDTDETAAAAGEDEIPQALKSGNETILSQGEEENTAQASCEENKTAQTQDAAPQCDDEKTASAQQYASDAYDFADIPSHEAETSTQAYADGAGTQASARPISMIECAIVKPSSPISLSGKEPQFTENALNALLEGETVRVERDEHTPTRIISDYSFLLGRTLTADLTAYTGEIVAKRGAEVTSYIVETARRVGKLVELILVSEKSPQR